MQTLYLFAVLAALATVAVCEHNPSMSKLHKECREESNATEAEIKKFFEAGMKVSDISDNIKCHMKCVMEKKGTFKAGVFNPEAEFKSFMQIPALKGHDTEVMQALNNCKNEKGTNDCDTAFKVTMCMREFKANI